MIEVGLSFAGGGLKSFAHVALTQDLERHQANRSPVPWVPPRTLAVGFVA